MNERIENYKPELIKNIDLTLNLIQQMTDLDNKVHKVLRKPIQIGCGGNITLIIILSMLTFAASLEFTLEIEESNFYKIPGVLYILCLLLIFIVNRTSLSMKKADNAQFLKEYPNKRKNLFLRLEAESVIPKTYWVPVYLNWMKTALSNKRADNLKEAINLLENEIKHTQTLQQISAIQDQLAQPQFFVGVTF
ncbi:hypothetical protein [Paenibacillus planticolens]|uniref:SMODS and SLOG-associating 2TM effector domain-containing protein n=1 Tax=Paenibacillus planticolens TaxID=2654976 RepID=A0ABX1ZT30_9BACL|nr:hypothetical protein [Paenibacillus planticolens]NOV03219.1 hypothetical protein [Paenibacillus planticolens]